MRILALDVGTKRIGIALSDELLLTAQGLESVERRRIEDDLAAIKRLVESNGVAEVVAGLPVNMDGSYGAKAKEVLDFLDVLAKTLKVPLKTWDERLTTAQAERTLLAADVSRAKRKVLSDRLAAQIILQSYLDSRRKE
jgi:putative Holliday junction resolvase